MMTGSPQLGKLGQGRSSTTFINRDCVVALGIGQRRRALPRNDDGDFHQEMRPSSITDVWRTCRCC